MGARLTKFVNELIRKEGYEYDIACVHNWVSSIAGNIIKNETMRTRRRTDKPSVFSEAYQGARVGLLASPGSWPVQQ